MKEIKLSKQAIIVIVLSLVSVCMLPAPFVRGYSFLDFMENMEFSGLLLWVFYVAFALTDLFLVINQMQLAKFASVISTCTVILSILVQFFRNIDGGFWGRLGAGAYCLVVASVISTIVVLRAAKKQG